MSSYISLGPFHEIENVLFYFFVDHIIAPSVQDGLVFTQLRKAPSVQDKINRISQPPFWIGSNNTWKFITLSFRKSNLAYVHKDILFWHMVNFDVKNVVSKPMISLKRLSMAVLHEN